MDFSLSEEQQAVADLATQIIGEMATPERLTEIERATDPKGPFDDTLWAALSEAGLLGIAVGEGFGGQGLDFVALTKVVEVVGSVAAYVPVVETLVSVADTIDRHGTEEQCSAWLPQIVDGSLIATAATAEFFGDLVAEGLSAPHTTATASGAGWVLDGVKACVPSGLRAELVLIPATFADGEVGLFLVDVADVDVERQDGPLLPEATLTLSGVEVGADRLLGGSTTGGRSILDSLALRTTAALCALEAGAARSALTLGATYTSEREQFGKKVATFQAVGQRLGDAYVDAEAISLTAAQASWRIATGVDATKAVAVAKFWAAEGGQRVVHAATHVHGGVGVDREYPLHRYFLLTRQIELTLGGATASLLTLGARVAATR